MSAINQKRFRLIIVLYSIGAILWLLLSRLLLTSLLFLPDWQSYSDYVLVLATAFVFYWAFRHVTRTGTPMLDPLAGEYNLSLILVDNAPDYVFVKDATSRYVLANKAYLRQVGAARLDQVVGKTDFDLFSEAVATRYVNDDRLVLQTGQPLIDQEEMRTDSTGKTLWITVTKVPLRDTSGKITGILGIIHDITERKQAADALAKVQEELESRVIERTAALAQANAALGAEIAEHRRTEQALRKSEALYRTLAENFPNGSVLLYDRDLRYILVEGAGLKPVGLSKEFLEGKTLSEGFPEQIELLEPAYRAALKGDPVYLDVPYGGNIYGVYVVPVKNEHGEVYAGMVMTQDITAYKAAETSLRESEQRFRVLSEATYEGVLIHETGIIVDANATFAQMTGYDPDTLIGKKIAALVTDDSHDLVAASTRLVASISVEVEMRRQDGSTFYADTRGRHVFYRGRNMSIVVVRDITYRKRIEAYLRNASSELERQVEARTAALSEANSRLQEEIEERCRVEAAEHEQRILAEALRDTAAALNSTLNFEEVLERILVNADRVVKHDRGNIMLIEAGFTRTVRTRGYPNAEAQDTILNARWPVATTPTFQWMIAHKKALVIPDVKEFYGWKREPAEEDWLAIGSYLGVPIVREGEVIGFLNLDCVPVGFFTPEHAARLEVFANQIATAVGNAHLYEQAKILAAMQERQRLARDLHDSVSQTLFSANAIAESLIPLFKKHPERVEQGVIELYQLIQGALAEMRTLLLELRPGALTETSLGALLHHLVEAIKGRITIDVSLSIDDQRSLPSDVQIVLYRIAQEALNNIARHAQASHISISLLNDQTRTDLHISDDGRGFDPAHIRPNHFGIGIMNERADSIGAALTVNSKIGSGTEVQVVWSERETKHTVDNPIKSSPAVHG
jgi:PAS domain S-box-containing protein